MVKSPAACGIRTCGAVESAIEPSAPAGNVRSVNAANARTVLRTVLIVVTVVLCLYVIYLLRRPLGLLAVALFIAVALSGPVNYLDRRMRRGFAIMFVYLGLLIIPIALG